jgi:PilZ domain
MPEAAREACAWVGCTNRSETEISQRPLCSHHFCMVAQRRVSALLGQRFTDDQFDRTVTPEVLQFLSELATETAKLSSPSHGLGAERLQELLKLSAQAAELQKRIQRPTRLRRRIPIIVSADAHDPSQNQESITVNIGAGGACIETTLRLYDGQVIWIERRDAKGKARARVAWARALPGGLCLAGIAFLEPTDIWDLASGFNSQRPAQSTDVEH